MITDQYAVMGNPIAHSKSPLIHAAFARATKQELVYRAILVEPGEFFTAVANFRATGGKGLNITVPFKGEAYSVAEILSARAKRALAVNTLYFNPEGYIYGDNTDGIGLVRDLTNNLGITLSGCRLLLIGAGGAARGILDPLFSAGVQSIFIVNRTAERARELAVAFTDLGEIAGGGWSELPPGHFDLIINATSASLIGEIPPLPEDIITGTVCYDLMYSTSRTPFLSWAHLHGAKRIADGLGMLVEQAAESFYLWRGIRPATAPLLSELHNRLETR